eukprot:125021-Hanusia_phi.AAC.2
MAEQSSSKKGEYCVTQRFCACVSCMGKPSNRLDRENLNQRNESAAAVTKRLMRNSRHALRIQLTATQTTRPYNTCNITRTCQSHIITPADAPMDAAKKSLFSSFKHKAPADPRHVHAPAAELSKNPNATDECCTRLTGSNFRVTTYLSHVLTNLRDAILRGCREQRESSACSWQVPRGR